MVSYILGERSEHILWECMGMAPDQTDRVRKMSGKKIEVGT